MRWEALLVAEASQVPLLLLTFQRHFPSSRTCCLRQAAQRTTLRHASQPVKTMDKKDQGRLVRTYFERLTAADYPGILTLFEPDGWVDSPFLGKVPAAEFFARLGKASSRNILTVHDVLFGENGDSAAAHFEYDWTLASGDKILFQGVDYFRFGPSGRFTSMSIFYDTHPTRDDVGDKYG